MSDISAPASTSTDCDFTDKCLLIIAPNYPNEDGSYFGSVFVKNQVDALKKYFREVIVIAPVLFSVGRLADDRLCQNYVYDNVRVYYPRSLYIPWPAYRRLNLGRLYFDTRASAVHALIEKENLTFDLIHAHFVWPSAKIAQGLKKRYGVPCVVTAHGYDVYELPFRNHIWQHRVESVLNSMDAIITVSRKNQACLEKLQFTTPVQVIPNGFSADLFYPRDQEECRRLLGLPQNKKIILTVGNLVEVKGQKYLVEAMERLVKSRTDILCAIVGSGFLRQTLEEQIQAAGLEDSVILAGGKPHEEIPVWMNACDLFVLPSLNEGNPTVMFECLGCGKPFVGTDVGGIGEIIRQGENGLVCEAGDSEGLSVAIAKGVEKDWNVSDIPEDSSRYSWGRVAGDILKVYSGMNESSWN